MPKNQFQRPTPIVHGHQVPRHGKAQPTPAKRAAKPLAKAPLANLPPLAALLDTGGSK